MCNKIIIINMDNGIMSVRKESLNCINNGLKYLMFWAGLFESRLTLNQD